MVMDTAAVLPLRYGTIVPYRGTRLTGVAVSAMYAGHPHGARHRPTRANSGRPDEC